jgi:hypothetical protein
MDNYVGCRVSLDCGELGFFQGVICGYALPSPPLSPSLHPSPLDLSFLRPPSLHSTPSQPSHPITNLFLHRINLAEQTVTLRKPFENGKASKFPELSLNASNIQASPVKIEEPSSHQSFLRS